MAEYVSEKSDSSTTLQLNWTHPLCDYGNRTGYNVRYHLTTLCQQYNLAYLLYSTQISYMPVIEGQANDGQMFTDHLATTTELSSLAPNTNYNIIICATTSVGCGNINSTVGLTNEDGMC